jgi:hypothetical protein
LFDAPQNEPKAFPILILILIYPFWTLISLFVGRKVYSKSKIVTYLLSALSVALIAVLAFKLYHF